jgi:hypothetical protein
MILTTDPIIGEQEAQRIFDFTGDEQVIHLINSLSAKARAFMQRDRLTQSLTTTIVEKLRGPSMPMLFLHAPVYDTDFSTYDLTVKVYSSAVLSDTYSANDSEVVVTTNDYSSRVDLVGGCFPETDGASWLEVEYYGGWSVVPGDVYAGAIMQGRVDLKRLNGEVGLVDHSHKGNSVEADQAGVIQEVADVWRKYRMLV